MLVTERSAEEVIGDQCGHFVVGRLVEVLLGHVRPVAAHGVVRVLSRELEGVVSAGATPAVGDLAGQAGDEAGTTRLKVSHGVEVTLAGGTHASSLKKKKTAAI